MRIARDFHWEMGHRLPFHQSGCANIHGHSYRLTVEIEGRCDDNGMLMDYGDMKRLIMPVIDELDHAFLCDDQDTLMMTFLSGSGLKHKVVPFTSTAENLTMFLLDEVWKLFEQRPEVNTLKLRLRETEISYAEAERSRTA
jgi:6-pyruvoyltetrahydropterin/6-carboxytetrahydropterin synthase